MVRIYKSFDEADAADSLARSRMSPQERVDVFLAIRERLIQMPIRVLTLQQS